MKVTIQSDTAALQALLKLAAVGFAAITDNIASQANAQTDNHAGADKPAESRVARTGNGSLERPDTPANAQ